MVALCSPDADSQVSPLTAMQTLLLNVSLVPQQQSPHNLALLPCSLATRHHLRVQMLIIIPLPLLLAIPVSVLLQDPTIVPLLAESTQLLKGIGTLLGAELHLSLQRVTPVTSSDDPPRPSVTYRSRGNPAAYGSFDPLAVKKSKPGAHGQPRRKGAGQPLPGISVQRATAGDGGGWGISSSSSSIMRQLSEQQKQAAARAAAASALSQAQASAAWLLSKLCAGPRHQEFRSYCRAVVPSLVTLLRDAQQQRGGAGGYSLEEVLTGIDRSLHAATASALQAMYKMDVGLKHRILAELALQLWLGHNVQLNGISEPREQE
jgi:hypothetical protein